MFRSDALASLLILVLLPLANSVNSTPGGGANQTLPSAGRRNYLGQKTPGMKSRIFAPGLVSTPDDSEFGGNFLPDGTEYYFSRRSRGTGPSSILYMYRGESGWSEPQRASFDSDYFDYEPCISRDGTQIFFGSKRPLSGTGPEQLLPRIWKARRTASGWAEPQDLGSPINGGFDGSPEFVSITNRKTLYFGEDTSQRPGNIYRSRWVGGRYLQPESLPAPVNSTYSDAHPLIAPDESFIIFDSTKPGGFGQGDLYISFRQQDDSWTEPENLGRRINTADWEVNPGLSHDGHYFFFFRNGDIRWIDAKAIGIVHPLIAADSDYDGDGKSDPAVFDPQTGRWKIRNQFSRKFGRKYSIPVPGDFNGDGKTDLAYFDPAKHRWAVRGQFKVRDFGTAGDIPVPGDYDGDGRTEIAFFRPYTGVWYILESSPSSATRQVSEVEFGRRGDLPVPGDYDGDGATDIAVFRPLSRQWLVDGHSPIKYGKAIDTPVPGDYNGDGTTDIAVWNPRTATWSVRGQFRRTFGKEGDIPVPGDYDGNGAVEIAVYDPFTGIWNVFEQSQVQHGTQGDVPLVLGN